MKLYMNIFFPLMIIYAKPGVVKTQRGDEDVLIGMLVQKDPGLSLPVGYYDTHWMAENWQEYNSSFILRNEPVDIFSK